MNIPPKYEDVVAQLEAAKMINLAGDHVESHLEKQIDILRIDLGSALGREAKLRTELDRTKKAYEAYGIDFDRSEEKAEYLQQRLTVAEQREVELKRLLCDVINEAPTGFAALNVYLANRVNDALKPD